MGGPLELAGRTGTRHAELTDPRGRKRCGQPRKSQWDADAHAVPAGRLSDNLQASRFSEPGLSQGELWRVTRQSDRDVIIRAHGPPLL